MRWWHIIAHKLLCLGGKNMPAYDMDLKVDDFIIKVNPSELKRFWFGRPTPFYNGTRIPLDIVVTVLMKKGVDVNNDLSFAWELVTHKEKKLYRGGSGVLHLSNREHHVYRTWLNNKNEISYSSDSRHHIFTKYRAIDIEPLLDFDTYDLIIKAKDQEGVVCQFTLQDIDEYGKDYKNLLVASLIGIISGFIGALIYVLFFGR
jgi:hypothetical protein